MAKKTEDPIEPTVPEPTVESPKEEPLAIGEPRNAFTVEEPSATSKKFLSAVLPHVINAVQAAYAGTAKVALDEKGKTFVDKLGSERLGTATAVIHVLDNINPRQSSEGICADYAIVEIEKTLAAMKHNGSLVK